MQPFKAWLDDPAYWSLNRRNVARAFALGLFVAFVPLPIHAILATALAWLLRLNIPAAVIGTFLTNPVTVVPLFVAAYRIGCTVLAHPRVPIQVEMSWQWFTTQLIPIWKPFLLGCFLMGLFTALLGYIALSGLWQLTVLAQQRSRKT